MFWLSLARNTCTAQVVPRRYTFYFTERKLKLKKKKKNDFPAIQVDQKQKCSVFTFVQYRQSDY